MQQASCILGIDPGASGGIAFYFPSYPERVSVQDMPAVDGRVSAAELAAIVRQFSPDAAIVELVGAMPGQGVSSTFKFGMAFGTACGVVSALHVPTHFVAPGKWKRSYGLDADKEKARRRAIELWPSCAEHFARKKDHGRAEAALIARYGAEHILSGGVA